MIAIQFEKPLMILGSVLEWLFCQAQDFFASYYIPLIPVSTQLLATSVNSSQKLMVEETRLKGILNSKCELGIEVVIRSSNKKFLSK